MTTLTDQESKQLLQRFFYLLDIVEESEASRAFRPNYISSCRANDGAEIEAILNTLKQWSVTS